jgi:hypothetical protein
VILVRYDQLNVPHGQLNCQALPAVKGESSATFAREIQAINMFPHHPKSAWNSAINKPSNIIESAWAIGPLFLKYHIFVHQLLFQFPFQFIFLGPWEASANLDTVQATHFIFGVAGAWALAGAVLLLYLLLVLFFTFLHFLHALLLIILFRLKIVEYDPFFILGQPHHRPIFVKDHWCPIHRIMVLEARYLIKTQERTEHLQCVNGVLCSCN